MLLAFIQPQCLTNTNPKALPNAAPSPYNNHWVSTACKSHANDRAK